MAPRNSGILKTYTSGFTKELAKCINKDIIERPVNSFKSEKKHLVQRFIMLSTIV